MDTFVDMVMRWPNTGPDDDGAGHLDNHEVDVLGVHLLLWTAQRMGIRSGVISARGRSTTCR